MCDTLAKSDTEITGNELMWVKLFEIIYPIRNLAMFAPAFADERDGTDGEGYFIEDGSVTSWSFVTKVLSDCALKVEEGVNDEGHIEYSTS